ncbi:MAG: hypothetical protein ABSG98_12240 [Anaerolineales bacterium]
MTRRLLFSLTLALSFLLAACTTSKDESAQAVQSLLQALVQRDEAHYTALTCGSYEDSALIEYDSFDLVQLSLKDLSCSQTGQNGNTATVHCTGSIQATYGNEVQSYDLSKRTYHLTLQGGDWLVCGYTQ